MAEKHSVNIGKMLRITGNSRPQGNAYGQRTYNKDEAYVRAMNGDNPGDFRVDKRPPDWSQRWGTNMWTNGDDRRKCFVCDKEGYSWTTCTERKSGNGYARCRSAAHCISTCPQRSDHKRKNSSQTESSDPLMFMLETKVIEVAGAPGGAKLLYYPLQVRRKKVKALLDSGASVNCIDADLVRSIGRCVLKKPLGNLLYPDRRKALVLGTTTLEVRGPGYREEVTFWVVKGLGVSVLLGAPWLRMWNPTINWQSRELTFSDGVRWKADKNEIDEKDQKVTVKIGKGEQMQAVGLCAHLRQSTLQNDMLIDTQPDDSIAIPDWLQKYRVVFNELTKIDREGRVKHRIRLQEGTVPCNRKPYRMLPA